MLNPDVWCRFGLCGRIAARTVKAKPYCKQHAEVVERIHRSIEKNKPLLDRLARDGDCLACVGTDRGCEKHRDPFKGDTDR